MQTVTKPSEMSATSLQNKWVLYYHLPQDRSWDLGSYKVIMSDIDRVDKLIALNESVPHKVMQYCMLFAMKKGITPMWEDKLNRDGGCFSYKVANKHVVDVWKSLMYAMCGETLCVNPKHNHFINGITISPKKNFCIVKIWLRGCELQDPASIIHIPNLTTNGCLFKKHEPEF